MPDRSTPPWRPRVLRMYEVVRAPLKRGLAKPVIEGCEVWASFGQMAVTVGPAPTPKNPRAQEIRWEPYLDISILRDGKEVAHARLAVGELEAVTPDR